MAVKGLKSNRNSSQSPKGDSYGSGIRQKLGISKENSMESTIKKKRLSKPPKSLA